MSKVEMPELMSTVDGEIYVALGWEDACAKARELTRAEAAEAAHRSNNWNEVVEELDSLHELAAKAVELLLKPNQRDALIIAHEINWRHPERSKLLAKAKGEA